MIVFASIFYFFLSMNVLYPSHHDECIEFPEATQILYYTNPSLKNFENNFHGIRINTGFSAFSHEYVNYINNSLSKIEGLKTVMFDQSFIDNDSAYYTKDSFIKTDISSIFFHKCIIELGAAYHYACTFENLESLETLSFSHTKMCSHALGSFLKKILNNPSLHTLNIHDSICSKEKKYLIESLGKYIQENTTLRILDLQGTIFTFNEFRNLLNHLYLRSYPLKLIVSKHGINRYSTHYMNTWFRKYYWPSGLDIIIA
jgi:hypothetical protein